MEYFKLYNKRTFLGHIGYDRESKIYFFIRSDNCIDFPPSMSDDVIVGTPKDFIFQEDIRTFVEDRIVPFGRQDLYCVLKEVTLTEYDAWEIFVRNSGMSLSDFFWIDSYGGSYLTHIRFTGKLPYQDRFTERGGSIIDDLKYKSLIDSILDGTIADVQVESGMGRDVYMFDTFVIKVPRNVLGTEQTKKEINVSNDCSTDLISRSLYSYKDCVVMERLESNPDILLDMLIDMGYSDFESFIRSNYLDKINQFATRYNLLVSDLCVLYNWGYDVKSNKFKILDYGFAKNMSKKIKKDLYCNAHIDSSEDIISMNYF